MNCVPGLSTQFAFTPTKTTALRLALHLLKKDKEKVEKFGLRL